MVSPGRRIIGARGAAAVLTCALLASCTPGVGGDDVAVVIPEIVETAPPEVPEVVGGEADFTGDDDERFAEWYSQQVTWEPCENDLECATIFAPLNWADPAAGSIELALNKRSASGTKIGSLLTNPGGPGGSGVNFLRYAWSNFGLPVQQAYDLIGFDPRGVGRSTPVVCADDAEKDEFISADFLRDEQGLAELAAANAAWGAACLENTGELLANVDSISVARDMDLIRALVGDEHLNFLGFSYGTQLGALYAGLFPDRVGRMVLDGGIDLALNADQLSAGQAIGFESALRAYVEDCLGRSACPLTGSVEQALAQITEIFEAALAGVISVRPDRTLTRTLAFHGLAMALYDQASWPFLTIALRQVIQDGTGELLLYLADFYNSRNADGTFDTNTTEAFIAVGCLDSRGTTDPAEMEANAIEILNAAPTVGFFFTHSGLGCWDWPVPFVGWDSMDLAAPGAPPILVVGTTGDPATPYEWSVALANTLESGVLLTNVGEGHTAYLAAGNCVNSIVDAFLVDGVVPERGTVCS